ncbi:MAG: helix-turn-helix domain-containing protein [Firmicutes bacterium]|nr:helix-turn-helix domain-containing protein [Bacillota bacterium]
MRYNIGSRLSELIFENELTNDKLVEELDISRQNISRWIQGKQGISLANAIKVANYFKCSLRYLLSETDNKLDFALRIHPPFYERLRGLMAERNITWYRIVKDGIASDYNLSAWKNGSEPYLETVIGIADYFKLTLDQFVGREV